MPTCQLEQRKEEKKRTLYHRHYFSNSELCWRRLTGDIMHHVRRCYRLGVDGLVSRVSCCLEQTFHNRNHLVERRERQKRKKGKHKQSTTKQVSSGEKSSKQNAQAPTTITHRKNSIFALLLPLLLLAHPPYPLPNSVFLIFWKHIFPHVVQYHGQ
jgi:hypothetical protein